MFTPERYSMQPESTHHTKQDTTRLGGFVEGFPKRNKYMKSRVGLREPCVGVNRNEPEIKILM